jgi:hypothetical protein
MKQLISRSLAYVGQQCPRVTWLAVLPLAMSLWLAFTPLAAPALAATNSHTTSHLAATKPASSIGLTQMGHVSVTSTVLTAPRDSAGDPCKQVSFQKNYLVAGNVVAWLKMVTNWCYDYVTVTSHSTILYWGVTAYGNVLGWQSVGNPLYSFNCYVASGSTRNCSGNHEHADQLFDNVPTLSGIGLTVDEKENYLGQAFTNGASRFCLGGCTH